ncbi:4-hydroxy-3-methylbut-2-enyl diphosphate reductase [Candidatus Poribacteria bacterium]|nr:4-hydroxy-3-methylbut-2-enyl diphosphate reductase [Candidatus Poribacteria bacterium]
MKIIKAKNAGFCFGVKRAMKLALEAAANNEKNIYSLGPLIHNPQEVELLSQKGVHVTSDLKSLGPGDVLIIRSHGTTPMVLEEARAKGVNIVDATCPFVVKAQKVAKQLSDEGYQVVIVGESNHPEVIGIRGFVGKDAWVVEKSEEIEFFPDKPRMGIIAQTTQSFENFQGVVCAVLEKTSELKAVNTICNATAYRQIEAMELTKNVDVMIVIGGRNSANTTRLAELCGQSGIPTHHVETAKELETSWLESKEKIGVTAGASTPDWIIKEVIDRLKILGVERKNS